MCLLYSNQINAALVSREGFFQIKITDFKFKLLNGVCDVTTRLFNPPPITDFIYIYVYIYIYIKKTAVALL